jgi:hypothetical protein
MVTPINKEAFIQFLTSGLAAGQHGFNERKLMHAIADAGPQGWIDAAAKKILNKAVIAPQTPLHAQVVTALDTQIDTLTRNYWLQCNAAKYTKNYPEHIPEPARSITPLDLLPVVVRRMSDDALSEPFDLMDQSPPSTPPPAYSPPRELSENEPMVELEPPTLPEKIVEAERHYEEAKKSLAPKVGLIYTTLPTTPQIRTAQDLLNNYVTLLLQGTNPDDVTEEQLKKNHVKLVKLQIPDQLASPIGFDRNTHLVYLESANAEKLQRVKVMCAELQDLVKLYVRKAKAGQNVQGDIARINKDTSQIVVWADAIVGEDQKTALNMYKELLHINFPIKLERGSNISFIALLDKIMKLDKEEGKKALGHALQWSTFYAIAKAPNSSFPELIKYANRFYKDGQLPGAIHFLKALITDNPDVDLPGYAKDLQATEKHLRNAVKNKPSNFLFLYFHHKILQEIHGKDRTEYDYDNQTRAQSMGFTNTNRSIWDRAGIGLTFFEHDNAPTRAWYNDRKNPLYYLPVIKDAGSKFSIFTNLLGGGLGTMD